MSCLGRDQIVETTIEVKRLGYSGCEFDQRQGLAVSFERYWGISAGTSVKEERASSIPDRTFVFWDFSLFKFAGCNILCLRGKWQQTWPGPYHSALLTELCPYRNAEEMLTTILVVEFRFFFAGCKRALDCLQISDQSGKQYSTDMSSMMAMGNQPSPSMMHSDSSSDMMMMMQMWFEATTKVTLWFREWKIDSDGKSVSIPLLKGIRCNLP